MVNGWTNDKAERTNSGAVMNGVCNLFNCGSDGLGFNYSPLNCICDKF